MQNGSKCMVTIYQRSTSEGRRVYFCTLTVIVKYKAHAWLHCIQMDILVLKKTVQKPLATAQNGTESHVDRIRKYVVLEQHFDKVEWNSGCATDYSNPKTKQIRWKVDIHGAVTIQDYDWQGLWVTPSCWGTTCVLNKSILLACFAALNDPYLLLPLLTYSPSSLCLSKFWQSGQPSTDLHNHFRNWVSPPST